MKKRLLITVSLFFLLVAVLIIWIIRLPRPSSDTTVVTINQQRIEIKVDPQLFTVDHINQTAFTTYLQALHILPLKFFVAGHTIQPDDQIVIQVLSVNSLTSANENYGLNLEEQQLQNQIASSFQQMTYMPSTHTFTMVLFINKSLISQYNSTPQMYLTLQILYELYLNSAAPTLITPQFRDNFLVYLQNILWTTPPIIILKNQTLTSELLHLFIPTAYADCGSMRCG